VHQRPRVEVDAQAVEQTPRLGVHLRTWALAAKQDVLRDVEGGNEREL
jgi:hypothetical protein